MSFELKRIEDLIRLASAGGGFRLNASLKQTTDLIKIASAASNSGARITFYGLGLRPIEDLIRIAAAGKGAITFEGS